VTQFGSPGMREFLAPFEVVATRGDAFSHRARPDADGKFRIDGLTPGAWCVMRDPAVRQSENDDGPGYTPEYSNCEVLEGVVTRHDLDLRPGPGTNLAVSAQIGSTPCAGWMLRVAGFAWRGTLLDGFHDLGPDGRLEIATVPGPAVLHVRGTIGDRSELNIRDQVMLRPGPATWAIYKTAGSVIELRMIEGSAEFLCTVHLGEDRRFLLDPIPAGAWLASNPADRAVPAIAFTVNAGQATQLELPW
jgi:hypothetical protein